MIFYYVRHGDPTYSPDDLTPLGLRQAEAIGRRLYRYGVDEVYSSNLVRAQKTAMPTCELCKKELNILPWTSENEAWKQLALPLENGGMSWFFAIPKYRDLLLTREVREMGDKWYDHPAFEGTTVKEGYLRIRNETRAFFAGLGFEWDDEKGQYKNLNFGVQTGKPEKRIALFAHHGFGTGFISNVLNIPYPEVCIKMNITHTGLTVFRFDDNKPYTIPQMLTLSSDAHLLADNLALNYDNVIRF